MSMVNRHSVRLNQPLRVKNLRTFLNFCRPSILLPAVLLLSCRSLSLSLSLSLPPSLPSLPPPSPPGFSLMLGLASFSRAYHDMEDTHASWSYSIGWIAFLLTLICATYFILIAVFRMRRPRSKSAYTSQQSTYTPLAQFEESSDSSEGDEKL